MDEAKLFLRFKKNDYDCADEQVVHMVLDYVMKNNFMRL